MSLNKKAIVFSFLVAIIFIVFFNNEIKSSARNLISDNVASVLRYTKRILIEKKPTYENESLELLKGFSGFLKNQKIYLNEREIDGYNLKEYNLPNIFPGKHGGAINSSYFDFYNDQIIIVSGSGVIFKCYIQDDYLVPEIINSNFHLYSNYKEFNTESQYGVKDILVKDGKLYISFTDKNKNGYNTSVVSGDLSKSYLKMDYVLKIDEFISDKNDEFNAHQSGGRLVNYNIDEILVSIGEYRQRSLAQNENSLNGKIISLNTTNGQCKIISKGHRNVQGLDFDSENDLILSSEHGPAGGDEINIHLNTKIKRNFGWPISSYGYHYDEKNEYSNHTLDKKREVDGAPLHKSHSKYNFEEPIKYFEINPGMSQVRIEKKDHNNLYFYASTLGYSSSPYTKSILYYKYDLNSKNLNLINHYKINERIRDINLYKGNLWYLGESTGVLGKLKIENEK